MSFFFYHVHAINGSNLLLKFTFSPKYHKYRIALAFDISSISRYLFNLNSRRVCLILKPRRREKKVIFRLIRIFMNERNAKRLEFETFNLIFISQNYRIAKKHKIFLEKKSNFYWPLMLHQGDENKLKITRSFSVYLQINLSSANLIFARFAAATYQLLANTRRSVQIIRSIKSIDKIYR